MIRVLGVDPGANIGWAYAVVEPNGRARFISGGVVREVEEIDLDKIAWPTVDGEEYTPAQLIAIEQAPHVYMREGFSAAMATGLAHASFVAGYLTALARDAGFSVAHVSAHEWRKAVVGNRQPKDAEVRQALERRVVDLPRSNAHVRDALGVAVFAGLRAIRLGMAA